MCCTNTSYMYANPLLILYDNRKEFHVSELVQIVGF